MEVPHSACIPSARGSQGTAGSWAVGATGVPADTFPQPRQVQVRTNAEMLGGTVAILNAVTLR